MRAYWIRSALAIAVAAGYSSHTLANGLAINEQSVSTMGTAHAGRSSAALDASTVYGNPAGMSKLDRMQVTGGFVTVKPDTSIHGLQGNRAPGTFTGDIAPTTTIPFGYFVMPINDNWHFGLGAYVPFGVISDYAKSSAGRFQGLYSKIQVMTVQPTLSYKFNDRFSIGFGPTINKIDGKLTSRLNTGVLPYTHGESQVSVKGDDTAYGFNVGMLFDITDYTRIGLTYHSKIDFHLKGHTKAEIADSRATSKVGLNSGRYDAKLDVRMPEMIDLSLTHRFADTPWMFHGGMSWTRWSRLDKIVVRNDGGGSLNPIKEDMKWRDAWSYSLGTSYQLNDQWILRAGISWDQSPTTNDHRTVRIPVSNRQIFTLGAGWSPTDDLTIDVAYGYIHEKQGKVTRGYDKPNPLKPGYSARYRNNAHGLGAQVTYRF